MKGFSARLTLTALMGLGLALLSLPSRLSASRPHGVCMLNPTLFSLCVRFQKSVPSSAADLTHALTDMRSSSNSEPLAFEYAAAWLLRHSFSVKRQPLSTPSKNGPRRENLLAMWRNSDPAKLQVLLCTHLDLVPGSGRPIGTPSRDGDRLRGRGTVDARGQAAGMMLSLKELRDSRVGLLLVSGEETDHAGMLAAADLGFGSHLILVNGEPTESQLGTVQKGMAKIVIRASGKAAHSGYPELGESAVHKLVALLGDLSREQWPKKDGEHTTMNVGKIAGGTASNIIAASAEAHVMFRLVTQPKEILERVSLIASAYDNVTVEELTYNAPVEFLVPQHAAETFGTTTVAYNTDVPYYRGEYTAAVLFGAGSIKHAHTSDEYANIAELNQLPERLTSIVRELLPTQ